MVACKDIKTHMDEICKVVGLELSPQVGDVLADGIEGFLVDIVERAGSVFKDGKRKLITAKDVFSVLSEEKLPIVDVLIASQRSGLCE
ncbi:hypothetical protein PAEPH01_0433 [Pancytospora epiphaga]|nr:hypothetical protein PAEPH01_0433 [Pancytospora epiphaga]